MVMKIECIKGFQIDGGSMGIMQGEVFQLVDADSNTFEGVVGMSRQPGMEIDFYEEQLINYFKIKLIV
jgi:hypothetical protein